MHDLKTLCKVMNMTVVTGELLTDEVTLAILLAAQNTAYNQHTINQVIQIKPATDL